MEGRLTSFRRVEERETREPTTCPNEAVATPTSSTFQALLASYNIAIDCTSNNATGNAQNLNFAPRIGFAFRAHSQSQWLRGGYGITYGALNNIGFRV